MSDAAAPAVDAAGYLSTLFGVQGKTVLVTGGGQGIGLMIAEGFVRAGARVYLASRKLAVCEEAAAALTADGGTCIPLAADLSTTALEVAAINVTWPSRRVSVDDVVSRHLPTLQSVAERIGSALETT